MRRLILKKESFGGTFADTQSAMLKFLRPEEYESKKNELLVSGADKVQVIDVTKKGYSLLTDATSTPNNIFWELTKKCNGACTDCFMSANSKKWIGDEITFSEIESITGQFVSLGGHSIRLTGGEPTLRPDFFDIVDMLNEEGMKIGLNTNGMFGEETLEKILSRSIKDIRISIDGPREVNDRIRWSGNYDGAIRTVQRISEYNKSATNPASPTINVVLMKSTIPHMEYMARLAHGYGFKVSFGLMRLSGRAQSSELLSPSEVVQASYRAQKIRDLLGLKRGALRVNYDIFCEGPQDGKGTALAGYNPYPFDNSKCSLGSSGLNIDAYGRLAPCGYLVNTEEWMGEDVRGRDLLDIWHNSPLLNRMRRLARDYCIGCGHYKVKCNGGCPAMAYFLDGNMNGIDPYCVKEVDIAKVIGDGAG